MKKKEKLIIKQLAEEDRPREKLVLKGLQSLSNAELIATLIRTGNKNETAIELAQRILSYADNNLGKLGKLSVKDLTGTFEGIGEAKAIAIISALELGRRRKKEENPVKHIRSSNDIYHLIYPYLVDLSHEELWVILLTPSNYVINLSKISQGGVSGTLVDVKIILKQALQHLASRIIVCHNHPSNQLNPSAADDELTEKIKKAAQLMDICLLDHLIVGEKTYYSYADKGKL